jgi:hypothetical protein
MASGGFAISADRGVITYRRRKKGIYIADIFPDGEEMRIVNESVNKCKCSHDKSGSELPVSSSH